MPETNISSATASEVAAIVEAFSVSNEATESSNDTKETRFQNAYWGQDFGYYSTIPEFKTAIDAKALWTMGAGYETDEITDMLLNGIKGNGKDSFNSILKNLIKVKTISGDSFAEVIRDKGGTLINLKPLDPSTMVIVQNGKGRIKRYEQTAKVKGGFKKFKKEEIFHLSHDRMADSAVGMRIVKALKWLIDARNEAMNDWRIVLHRNVFPLWIFHLDTDDEGEISGFKTKMDKAHVNGENMYVPKGAVVPELVTTAANATLNPLQWIDKLNDYFFQAVMVPQILFGNAKGFTDASGKIVYLAYEQSVKAEQLYIEEQVLSQLNLEIALTFPASLQNDLISDGDKDPMTGAAEPNDTVAEVEGQ